MAKKENNTNTAVPLGSLGEISTIRDILMGQQINEFTQKFNALENRILDLEKELEKKTVELEKANQKKFMQLNKEIDNKVQKLSTLFEQNDDEIDQKLAALEERNRIELGKTLLKLSKKLLEE